MKPRLTVLGFGEEVGHDREEQGERRGEDEADVGVEDGADIRDAAEKVEVEEHSGEDEHEDGAGHTMEASLLSSMYVEVRLYTKFEMDAHRSEPELDMPPMVACTSGPGIIASSSWRLRGS